MEYSQLQTERRNPASISLDQMSVMDAARLMNQQDSEIPVAVEKALPEIVEVVEMAANSFKAGGRLVYCGAGTSGRLGVLDASECLPTFGVSPDMVVGKIAGGDGALRFAVEGAEDDANLGASEMQNLDICEKDVVVAVSASGSAAYCLGALDYAREQKAKTAGVCCVENPAFAESCDCLIRAVVGPEILTGSTRLRAGTATKMVLNMISTLSMKEIGKVYKNLMVDVVPSNKKLQDRARRIVMAACNIERSQAEQLLQECEGEVKTAIVCQEAGVEPNVAREALDSTDGFVRAAIDVVNE